MRIAVFTDSFYPKIDGIVTSTISLAKGLANRGHKICVIAPKYKNAKEFRYKNVKVIRVASIPALFYPGFKFTSPFSSNILEHLKKEKIDIIHFQTPITLGVQAIIAAKLLKIPLVGTFHTFFANPQYLEHIKMNYGFIQKVSWAYAKAYYNKCDLITCPSEVAKRELLKHGFINKIKAISNGIDSSIFNNSKYKQVRNKYSKKGNLILFVGRIAHEKNIFYLLDCFKLILKKLPETKLIIVGDGPQLKELKESVKSLNLSGKVIIIGKIAHEKLVKSSIFKASDLFVTASTTETQGITMLEAQANGLVCVGIDAGGTKELIKNNYNGYLVKKGNKRDFANKTVKLLLNSSLRERMQKNTLKEIKHHFISNVIEIWEKVYSELITKNER